jgi:hypothetical protein
MCLFGEITIRSVAEHHQSRVETPSTLLTPLDLQSDQAALAGRAHQVWGRYLLVPVQGEALPPAAGLAAGKVTLLIFAPPKPVLPPCVA